MCVCACMCKYIDVLFCQLCWNNLYSRIVGKSATLNCLQLLPLAFRFFQTDLQKEKYWISLFTVQTPRMGASGGEN